MKKTTKKDKMPMSKKEHKGMMKDMKKGKKGC